jgi:lambda family phage portal protein
VLLPGEEIVAPEVPTTGDYVSFMTCELRKFAAAVGLTYEQLTNDYTKVNYSSARVALLEFRRSAEQFQQQVMIDGFCAKVLRRWMQEAVLSGALELPDDYVSSPEQYEACMWVTDGWQWVDPLKEAQAAQQMIRDGLKSRSMVIRENGLDPETVDNEIAAERQRETDLGLVLDTNGNLVLIGRETISPDPTEAKPNEEGDQEADEASNQS